MTRIKTFAAPHKALRNAISQFSFRLGHTDFTNADQLQQLKDLGNDLFFMLNDHVHIEEGHTLHMLEEKAPGTTRKDREDHEQLELIQDSLQQKLMQFTGTESADETHDFYIQFSNFQSKYLEHIYQEETVTELLLQQHFTDEELVQHRNTILKSLEFPTLLLWMKYMIPAQSQAENIGMLTGLKSGAPEEAFNTVLNTVQKEMDPARFESLVLHLP